MNKYCEYKNLKLGKFEAKEVTKEDIDNEINSILSQDVSYVEKEAESKLGDVVNIDFEGFSNGIAFEGGKGSNYDLELGSNTFIAGFEVQLVGLKKGDKKDVNVTFPEDYHSEELKGKPALFKCKINAVKEKKISVLNDEFAKKNGFENVEKFIEAVNNHLIEVSDTNAKNQYITKICDYLAENSEIELSEELINSRLDEIISYYEKSMAQYGATLEQYLQMTNTDLAVFKENIKPEAIKSLKIDAVYDYIVESEQLFITEEEIEKEFNFIREYYHLNDDQFNKFKLERYNEIKAECQRQKVSQFLFLNND